MANLPVKDGSGASAEIKARGTGTSGDPYVVQQDQNLLVSGIDVSTTNPIPVRTVAQTASAANTATATNASVSVTYSAAGAGLCHAIDGVVASLSIDPAAAVSLTVQDGSNTVFQTHLTRSGPAPINYPLRGTANTSMTITLAAGGSNVIGCVNVTGKRIVS